MNSASFIGLLNNAAILLALGVIYDALGLHAITDRKRRQLLSGVLVGLVGVAVMHTPWELSPGIFFDTRWVLISLCALFFGVVPTLIAATMTVSLRLYQGGAGAIVGSLVIILPAMIGLVWRYSYKQRHLKLNWLQLYLFGLLIQLVVLACLLLMPESVRFKIIEAVWLPMLLVFPVGTMLLGLVLRRQQDRRAAEVALLENRQLLDREHGLLRGLINAIPDPISFKDADDRYLGCNRAFEIQLGCTEAQIIGQNDQQLKVIRARKPVMNNYPSQDDQDSNEQFEHWVDYADGRRVLHETLQAPFQGEDGTHYGQIEVSRNITERRKAEEQIRNLAFYDPLTQLPNRRLLMDRLQIQIASSARNNRYGALLFIDLDHFKALNDTQGHNAGDQLLVAVAARLQSSLRQEDSVARLGGDEFVVMIGDLSSDQVKAAVTAEEIAEKIRLELCQPYLLNESDKDNPTKQYHSTPSIGISLFHSGLGNQDEVLKQADMAMYQSKAAGRNAIHFFDPLMQAALEQATELAADLHDAIDNNELVLFYQVQINEHRGICGAEVLLRWQHPVRGMVSPLEFIPAAEETGLIIPIGDWVLLQACLQLKQWQGHPVQQKWQIAVNVSARQFRQQDFPERVQQIVAETGIDPARLKLELTESLVLDDVEGTITKMKQLNRLGIHFSMDDFGTGQSSLSNLKRLPLQQLKIDRSFVQDICIDSENSAITKAIISLSKSLNLEVIAEGVETEQQRQFLLDNGCHHYQGFLFSRPLPLAEFEALIATGAMATSD